MKPHERIEVADELGECVLWDDIAGAVWWTDIEGRTLHRLDWETRALMHYPTPARLASFGFIDGRRELIAAFDNGFTLYDPLRGTVDTLGRPEGLGKGQRMNDGRVDRQGRFWAGGMMEAEESRSEACLYCVADGRIETRVRGIGIANGLCWSPDGTVCYFADSRQGTIWRFAFDPDTGALSGRTEFARSAAGMCPDGAAVDSEGYVWSAQWGGGCVIRYAPDGRVDSVLDVPVSQPTCVTFGGPGRDHLLVTTARCGRAAGETGAGDLFVYNVAVQGLKESRFDIGTWPQAAELEG
jgi:sugar lactone lactonase YvrE